MAKDKVPAFLAALQQQLHLAMGDPAAKAVARRHAHNKAAKRARRTNRRKK